MSGGHVVIEREIFIAASPETIFHFLVDPLLMARWIGSSHTLEPRVNGLLRVEFSRGDVASGQYKEIVPNRRVVFTWGWESKDPALRTLKPGESLVEIELEPQRGGTLLRLRHSRLPKGISEMHEDRWAYYLKKLLAAVLEVR